MSTNNVTVTASFGATAEGNFLFAATGSLISDQNVAIVTPVVQGVLDTSGNLSAVLLASDNFGSGELTWNAFLDIRGMNRILVQDFTVNFANGASQNLFAILTAAGWDPTDS